MTVASTKTKEIYKGNGSTTIFPVPYQYSKTDTIILVFTDAAGKDNIVTSNYRIDVNASGNTTVLYPVTGNPIPAGTKLTVYRSTPLTQIVDLIYGGAFNPDVLEGDGFDRIVMMVQEIQEEVDRSFKVPISSDQDPDDLMQDLFDAAESAAQSAEEAAKSAAAAKESETNAAGSAALAEEARDWACQCAERAEEARDVTIAQAETANGVIANGLAQISAIVQHGKQIITSFVEESIVEINTIISSGINTINGILATELAKINAIIAANKDDQQAAISKAREWAEKDTNIPVEIDSDGERYYSAKHWAQKANEIALPPSSESVRGGIKVGFGLKITDSDRLNVDMGAVWPKGIISMWSGAVNAVPDGWALCNGQNGTPNLMDRFVVGAGSGYAVGATGGAYNHAHAITVGNTTLAEWQMPSHVHTVNGFRTITNHGSKFGTSGQEIAVLGNEAYAWRPNTFATGGSGAHNHAGSSDVRDHRPPYYALAYIMKL